MKLEMEELNNEVASVEQQVSISNQPGRLGNDLNTRPFC